MEVDGGDAPAGTVVSAVIGGDTYSTTTPAMDQPGFESTYALIVGSSGLDYEQGTEVTFMIDGRVAQQTGIRTVGSNIELNLSVGTEVSFNLWVIVGPILGVLTAGTVVYFLVRRASRPSG